MIILTLRTDKPEAELGLFADKKRKSYNIWKAHRQLAETIHEEIESVLSSGKLDIKNLQGVVVFKGPGSFTGLRIGVSVANAVAAGLEIPAVGSSGEDWLQKGIKRLLAGENDIVVLPEYGSPPHITAQKK